MCLTPTTPVMEAIMYHVSSVKEIKPFLPMSVDVRFAIEDGIALTYVRGVKATLNATDANTIISFARNLPDNAKYCEAGTYLGGSALLVALHSNAIVWAHDVWDISGQLKPGQLPEDAEHQSLLVNDALFQFYNAVKQNNLIQRIIPMRGDSKYTMNAHDDKSLDLAFIDGDHSFEGAYGDLVTVFPKIKSGGTILAHDCIPNSDPLRAMEKFTQENNLKFYIVPGSWGMAVVNIP